MSPSPLPPSQVSSNAAKKGEREGGEEGLREGRGGLPRKTLFPSPPSSATPPPFFARAGMRKTEGGRPLLLLLTAISSEGTLPQRRELEKRGGGKEKE